MTTAITAYNVDAERALLGILMDSPQLADSCGVRPGDLDPLPGHDVILSAVLEVFDAHRTADPVLVLDHLARRDQLSRVGNESARAGAYITELVGAGRGLPSVQHYARLVRAATVRRQIYEVGSRLVQSATTTPDLDVMLDAAASMSVQLGMLVDEPIDGDAPIPGLSLIEDFINEPSPPHSWVIPGIVERADRIMLIAGEGVGKALAIDTPVPTTAGWQAMGDLVVGDRVFGPDGLPTEVVATTPVMTDRSCYRVEFSDGSHIVADAQHQWHTRTLLDRGKGRPGSVITTEQMAATVKARAGFALNHAIEVCEPLQFGPLDLPIHPYVLGTWLGDGHSYGSGFSCADIEIIEEIARHEPVRKLTGRYAWSISGGRGEGFKKRSLKHRLRELGVLQNKHIPNQYLVASVDQRLALLRGLMDTDGNVTAKVNSHTCEFTTTSEQLADGVLALVRSLGIKATSRPGWATLDGRVIGPKWRITFTTSLRVFHLPRKAERQTQSTTTRSRQRYVTAVVPVDSVPVRCIQVARDDGLFVAGEACIVTHNSVLARQVVTLLAAGRHPFMPKAVIRPRRALLVDLENPPDLVRRGLRGVVGQIHAEGLELGDRAWRWNRPGGIDLRGSADRKLLARVIEKTRPDLVAIGPVYKAYASRPGDSHETGPAEFGAAIDRLRERYGCAFWIEHHAPKASGGEARRTDPIGSSYWLRWPEFGLVLKREPHSESNVYMLDRFRGDRDIRCWPDQLIKHASRWPWATDYDPDNKDALFRAIDEDNAIPIPDPGGTPA